MRTLAVSDCPEAIKVRTVNLYDEGTVTGTVQVPASYCWQFADLSGKRSYINADDTPWEGFEQEEPGEIVGYLAKVHPVTGEIKWAGEPGSMSPVYEDQLSFWQGKGLLVTAKKREK